jgi:hypothetical protein
MFPLCVNLIENPKQLSYENYSNFTKIIRYKINVEKLISLPHINNKQVGKNLKNKLKIIPNRSRS